MDRSNILLTFPIGQRCRVKDTPTTPTFFRKGQEGVIIRHVWSLPWPIEMEMGDGGRPACFRPGELEPIP